MIRYGQTFGDFKRLKVSQQTGTKFKELFTTSFLVVFPIFISKLESNSLSHKIFNISHTPHLRNVLECYSKVEHKLMCYHVIAQYYTFCYLKVKLNRIEKCRAYLPYKKIKLNSKSFKAYLSVTTVRKTVTQRFVT